MSFLRFVFGFAFLSVLPAALEGVHEEENLEAALRSFRSAKSADFSRLPQPNPLMPAPAFPFELQLLANAAPVRDAVSGFASVESNFENVISVLSAHRSLKETARLLAVLAPLFRLQEGGSTIFTHEFEIEIEAEESTSPDSLMYLIHRRFLNVPIAAPSKQVVGTVVFLCQRVI